MKVTGPAVLWERTSSDKAVRSFEDAYAVVSERLSSLAKDNPIFEAHLEMLQDPMVTDTVQANMAAGMQPLKALDSAGNAIASMFAGIDDEYLAARVDDVRDIFRRLRDAMTGNSSPQAEFPEGGILVAEELLPSDTSKIDFSKVRGILCAKGSTTSHVCIIARSKGVPIRVGADISGIREGDPVEVEDPLVGGQEEVVSKLRAAGRKVYVNAGSISDIVSRHRLPSSLSKEARNLFALKHFSFHSSYTGMSSSMSFRRTSLASTRCFSSSSLMFLLSSF